MQISGLTLKFAACGSKLASSKNKLMVSSRIPSAMKQILWLVLELSYQNWMSLSFISRFRLVLLFSKIILKNTFLWGVGVGGADVKSGFLRINFIWCNKMRPSHTLKINQWNTWSQRACLLFLWWQTAGISLIHGQFSVSSPCSLWRIKSNSDHDLHVYPPSANDDQNTENTDGVKNAHQCPPDEIASASSSEKSFSSYLSSLENSASLYQTCLLLRFWRIFYAFGLKNTHYGSLLQNYAHEKIPIF